MNNPPYNAWRLIEDHIHVMPGGHEYPLYTDDELHRESHDWASLSGIYTKVAPGLGITGIYLLDEQVEEYEETRTWTIW